MHDTDRDLLPEGLGDRSPAQAAAASQVRRGCLDVFASHGYDRVETPTIEFEKSMASRMAGVQPRRMFRLVDPVSLRTLSLRSDITVQVGRIAVTSLAAKPRPLRLCYCGQVLTIKGDGLDPARERLQLGAELIGADSVAAASTSSRFFSGDACSCSEPTRPCAMLSAMSVLKRTGFCSTRPMNER